MPAVCDIHGTVGDPEQLAFVPRLPFQKVEYLTVAFDDQIVERNLNAFGDFHLLLALLRFKNPIDQLARPCRHLAHQASGVPAPGRLVRASIA